MKLAPPAVGHRRGKLGGVEIIGEGFFKISLFCQGVAQLDLISPRFSGWRTAMGFQDLLRLRKPPCLRQYKRQEQVGR